MRSLECEVMMKTKLVAFVVVLLLGQSVLAEERPAMSAVDRTRLAEVFRLGEAIGDRIWKDWSKAPFAVLLVTPDYEFLVRHPRPSPDFAPLGDDPLLKSTVYVRQRILPTRLLATAPFIKGSMTPTIVVGQAENTEAKTSTPWVITLLHEHFHQLQSSQPSYYADVKALNLAHGDETGGWMLNYAFPYDRKEVQEQFTALSGLLAEALNARDKARRSTRLAAYLQARRQFRKMLSPDDDRYFSFQFWQEGIARYTEYRVAQLAAAHYRPSQEFRALKDFTSFKQEAEATRERIIRQLLTERLGAARREVVYPFGAAEGLLLDSVNPSWRSRYFVDKFDLGKYFEAAR